MRPGDHTDPHPNCGSQVIQPTSLMCTLACRLRRGGSESEECPSRKSPAGGIAGLLQLSSTLGDERLLSAASLLGDDLLAAGQRSDAGLSWPTTSYPTQGNLTGFSHGAAGAGYALGNLFARTGDDRARRGAVEAFAYEASLFDPATRNWPDLRAHAGTHAGAASFATFWCHGAPGIALSRLGALQVLGREPYEAEALAAVATPMDSVSAALPTLSGSFSLCHGAGGQRRGAACRPGGPVARGLLVAGSRPQGRSRRHPTLRERDRALARRNLRRNDSEPVPRPGRHRPLLSAPPRPTGPDPPHPGRTARIRRAREVRSRTRACARCAPNLGGRR